jgi:hypothetical protein
MSFTLLYLVSSPRSGSTLLQNILSNNEKVNTTNEPWVLFHFLNFYNPELVNAEYSYNLAHVATQQFLDNSGGNEAFKSSIKRSLSEIYGVLDKEGNASYILDKTPRYYEILPSINAFLPDAKIIILKRNPLEVLNSIIETWKVKNLTQLYPYRRDLLYAPFLMQDFIIAKNGAENVYTLHYEELIQRPELEVPRLFKWLGLEYVESYLDYSGNKKGNGKFGDKSALFAEGKPIQKKERWQEKMHTQRWKDFFIGYADYLGLEFLNEYGYPLDITPKRTTQFNTFKYMCDLKVPESKPIKEPFKHAFYRGLFWLYKLI